MAVVKLNQFKLFVLDKYVDEVTKYTASTEFVNYLNYKEADISDCDKLTGYDVSEVISRIAILKKKVTDICKILEITIAPGLLKEKKITIDIYKNITSYSERIGTIESRVLKIVERINTLKQEITKFTNIKQKLEFLLNVNCNISDLSKFSFLEIDYGRLSKVNYERMKEVFNDKNVLLFELKSEENYIYTIVFYLKSYKETIEKIFNSLYFEVYDIPENISGVPSETIKEISTKLKVLELELQKKIIEKDELRIIYEEEMLDKYCDLTGNNIIKDIEKQYGMTKRVFMFTGWVPAELESKYIESIEKITNDSSIYYSQPAEEYYYKKQKKIVVPTLLKNNWLFKPFEMIVKMYGIPSYFEFDPSMLVGISFILMFGMMFGDVGQGLVIFLGGWLLGKKFPAFKEPSILIRAIASSSIFFGFMYGEYFGFKLMPHIWIEPMESTDFFLPFTVILGIIFMTIGLAIKVMNCIRIKDYENLLFGKSGAAGIIFYWGTLITALCAFFKLIEIGKNIQTILIVIIIWFIPLILMFLKEPLGAKVEKRKFHLHGGMFDFVLAAGAELLDTVLSYLGNTISFVRIAAFALNHAGLFAVVKILTEMINLGKYDPIGDTILFIVGNIVIICVEGLIVTIQVLRLEFYEFFSKFFSGDGVNYKPATLSEDN